MLSVTNVGLSAIANAEEGGFLIDLATFAVSEADVSAMPDADKILTEGMQGETVYEAAITSIEVVDTSAVRLTLTVPTTVPLDGSTKVLREIGIFLASGELFAYGSLEPAYEKTNEYAIKIYVVVVANRLGNVINVVVSNSNSLPATPFVRSLVPPSKTYQNTIIVLDQKTNEYQDAHSASIAVKTGPGSSHWSFLEHTRIYAGAFDYLESASTFVLDPSRGGFWLNDGEIVIGQIIGGQGDGYSRKLRYEKGTGRFTVVDVEWARISSSSKIAIWRCMQNQLPSRTDDMEEYLVLGVGINDWKQTVFNGNSTRYRIVYGEGNLGTGGLYTDSQIIGASEASSLVYIDGRLVPYGAYTIANDQLYVPAGQGKQFNAFFLVPDQTTDGATLMKFESEYPTDGTTTRYYLPIVPDNTGSVLVFLNDTYIDKTQYTYSGTSILFETPPSLGTLRTVCLANYDDSDSSTSVQRFFYQIVEGGSRTVEINAGTFDKSRVLASVNGKFIPQEKYTLTEYSLTLNVAPEYVGGLAVLDIMVFGTTDNSVALAYSGADTGPEWVDPAGRLGPPNKLVPRVMSYTSDGSQIEYRVYNVPRKAHIVMIAGGAHQDPRNMTFIRGNKNSLYGTIELSQAIPVGVKIDFICFTDVKDPGTATLCEVFNFTTTSSLSYEINPVDNDEAIIVVIGGAYQHRGSFTISNGNRLNLASVEAGMSAEVWYFKHVSHAGWRTEMYVDYNTSGWVNSYPLTHRVAREQNTLVFLNSVYQFKNKYGVVEANGLQQVVYDSPLEATYHNQPLINVYFVSGEPMTRLLLREDGENAYMPRSGPYVDWPNLSYRLRDMLACPITKLLAMVTGTMALDFNNGTSDDQDLANKYGLQPVTKTLTMSVLPTAAYAGIGSGATLGAKMSFNVYKYLELYLKEQLGSATFTIHKYEQGVKYFIDDIKLGELQYEALTRSEIPMMTYDTGIFINHPSALTGVTYPGIPLLTNFFDMAFSRDNVVLPSGFALTSYSTLKTTSVTFADDDSTQTRTFTHVVQDGFSSKSYTIKWSRPYTVPDHNTEYMTLVDANGAPGYVQYFARLYAQWRYMDEDIIKCMYYNKKSSHYDGWWCTWIVKVRGGSAGGNYPAVAGYTKGLTFGVTVDNYDASTGQADLLIEMTSGTIGYSYFPAEMLIKSITIPVTYTIYPAISVNPDGTVSPMLSNEDLFNSCCWTDMTPQTVLNCSGSGTVTPPTVGKLITSNARPVIKGTYPYQQATSLAVVIDNITYVNGVSSALTTNVEVWELDLAQTSQSLVPGFYDVVVRISLSDGTTLEDSTVNEIYVKAVVDSTPPTAPTINVQTFYTLKPKISGTYPASDAAGGLAVSINGWTYTLGSNVASDSNANTRTLSSAPLSASGDTWQLDLSKDTVNALDYVVYDVSANVIDATGNLASDTTTAEITLIAPNPVLKASYNSPVISGVTNVNSGSIGLGAPFTGRTIVVCAHVSRYVNTAWDITDITLGGKTLTQAAYVRGSDSRGKAGIWYIHDDTMTTADLDITTSTTLMAWSYHVYVLNGNNLVPVDVHAENGSDLAAGSTYPETPPWTFTLNGQTNNQAITMIWGLMLNSEAINFDAPLQNSLTTVYPYSSYYSSTTSGYGVLADGANTIRATAVGNSADVIYKMGVVFA